MIVLRHVVVASLLTHQ